MGSLFEKLHGAVRHRSRTAFQLAPVWSNVVTIRNYAINNSLQPAAQARAVPRVQGAAAADAG